MESMRYILLKTIILVSEMRDFSRKYDLLEKVCSNQIPNDMYWSEVVICFVTGTKPGSMVTYKKYKKTHKKTAVET